jgi:OmpA-OmpF porin, OOP family
LPDGASLDRIYAICNWLADHPDKKLYVNGYADSKGDGVKNYKLSIERAESARQFMMEHCGVPQSRLLLRPFGEAFPEFEETSAENIRKNRRVTFEIAPDDATETPY